MDSKHLEELAELEESYWWHVAKRELISELLLSHAPPPARLIEAGVGAGGNLARFRDLGYEVAGMDISEQAVRMCHERGLSDVVRHDISKPWPMPPRSRNIAVLLDVIEHCEDASAVLRNAHAVLEPGGWVIVNVPALPWLYCPWDKALGHYRRYSAKQLRAHAANAGLEEIRLSHWNAFSLPAAIVVRTVQKYFGRGSPSFPRIPDLLNRLLIHTARLERLILRTGLLPIGLSLVGLFRTGLATEPTVGSSLLAQNSF